MITIEDAERAVLCALFRAEMADLVWIGGSVLHLLYSSPRASYDLDLCPRHQAPPASEIKQLIRRALEELNAMSQGGFALQEQTTGNQSDFRSLVTNRGALAFSVDFTRIAGGVGETSVVVIESVLGPQAVTVATDASLLAMKWEALCFRRFLKPADVFDVWFLLGRGVRLKKQQREWLSDQAALKEIEWVDVQERFDRLTPERFLAELKRRMPDAEFHSWNLRRTQNAIRSVLRFAEKAVRWR